VPPVEGCHRFQGPPRIAQDPPSISAQQRPRPGGDPPHLVVFRLFLQGSKARIADVLLDLAYRFGADYGRRIKLDHWFTHKDLADLAGTHRPTVTTAINYWIYDGVLRQQPRGLIINKTRDAQKGGYRGFQKGGKEPGHPLTVISRKDRFFRPLADFSRS
jgi:hypothetical protein